MSICLVIMFLLKCFCSTLLCWLHSAFFCVFVCCGVWVLIALDTFFFCRQKTAYEVRISDWSSDVCSSDLGWRWLAAASCGRRRRRRAPPGRPRSARAAPRRRYPRRRRSRHSGRGLCAAASSVWNSCRDCSLSWPRCRCPPPLQPVAACPANQSSQPNIRDNRHSCMVKENPSMQGTAHPAVRSLAMRFGRFGVSLWGKQHVVCADDGRAGAAGGGGLRPGRLPAGGAQSAADSQSCVQPYARDLAAARCAGVARGGRESAARGAGGTRRHAAARHPYHYFAGRPGADTAVLPAGAAALLPAGAPAPRPHAAVGRQPADPLRRLPRRIEDVLPAADPAGTATLCPSVHVFARPGWCGPCCCTSGGGVSLSGWPAGTAASCCRRSPTRGSSAAASAANRRCPTCSRSRRPCNAGSRRPTSRSPRRASRARTAWPRWRRRSRAADSPSRWWSRDRKSVVSGKSVSVRLDPGGRRIIKKKKTNKKLEDSDT